jgi:anti-sigma B factor antagonist
MPPTNVSIQVEQINPTTSRLSIQGDLSSTAENALMDAYSKASTTTTRVIILDFTRLSYMNSSGIGLLVTLLIRMNRQKQRMLCYGLNEHYRHIFTLTRLNDVITVHQTLEEALADAGH